MLRTRWPMLAEVLDRENVDVVILDEEFTTVVDRGLAHRPQTVRILAWSEADSARAELTVDGLIDAHEGAVPTEAATRSRVVLLTSGTTGTPKGARSTSGVAQAN